MAFATRLALLHQRSFLNTLKKGQGRRAFFDPRCSFGTAACHCFCLPGKQYDLLVRQKVKMTFLLDTSKLRSRSADTVITTPFWKAASRP